MIDPTNHRGIAYLVLTWGLTFIATIVCTIRLYSRTILTRSVGSDDFTILVALVCTKSTLPRYDQQLAENDAGITHRGQCRRYHGSLQWFWTARKLGTASRH